MAKKPEEILAELQKQKEDIEILLSSLEDAYSEASITEEHYKEVKTKNQKKLKDLETRIGRIDARVEKGMKKEEKKAKAEAKKVAKKEVKEKKAEEKKPKTVGEMIAAEQEVPVSMPAEGEGLVEAEKPAPETAPSLAPEAPGPAPEKPGEKRFTSDDIKGMLSRFIKEIKPGGLEVLPKVEKMEVRLEKMAAFLDAIKEEKTSRDETIRRLTEEIGEIRSSTGSLDRKTSQHEILLNEINTSVADLKPQRFIKFLRKTDIQTKMHSSKIERLEEMNSLTVKKLTQIENVLKRIGSLEKIADFGRDIAKRLVEIENREKRIGRISDKIDSIFMELNKRLDEFTLYRAKQDTLDELSREMMKAVDDINTKLEKYAEKEDIEMLRETLEGRITGASAAAAASPEVAGLQKQKEEIEGLLDILEEQFKKGELKKEEYEKAKKVNMERMESISRKIEQSKALPAGAPAPAQEPTGQPAPEPIKEEEKAEEKPATGEPAAEEPVKVRGVKKKPMKPEPATGGKSKGRGMMSDLEESYEKGEISKSVLDRVKKLLRK